MSLLNAPGQRRQICTCAIQGAVGKNCPSWSIPDSVNKPETVSSGVSRERQLEHRRISVGGSIILATPPSSRAPLDVARRRDQTRVRHPRRGKLVKRILNVRTSTPDTTDQWAGWHAPVPVLARTPEQLKQVGAVREGNVWKVSLEDLKQGNEVVVGWVALIKRQFFPRADRPPFAGGPKERTSEMARLRCRRSTLSD